MNVAGNSVNAASEPGAKVTKHPPPLCCLNEGQKAIIEADFGMLNGQLVVPSRPALVKYAIPSNRHWRLMTAVRGVPSCAPGA